MYAYKIKNIVIYIVTKVLETYHGRCVSVRREMVWCYVNGKSRILHSSDDK